MINRSIDQCTSLETPPPSPYHGQPFLVHFFFSFRLALIPLFHHIGTPSYIQHPTPYGNTIYLSNPFGTASNNPLLSSHFFEKSRSA